MCGSSQGLGMAALPAAPLRSHLALLLLFFENPTRLHLIISTLLPLSSPCLCASFTPSQLGTLHVFPYQGQFVLPRYSWMYVSYRSMVNFSGAMLLGKIDPSLPAGDSLQRLPSQRQDFMPTAPSCWDVVCLDLPRSCTCCHTAVRSYALLVLAVRSCAWLLKTKSSQHFQTSVKNKYLRVLKSKAENQLSLAQLKKF